MNKLSYRLLTIFCFGLLAVLISTQFSSARISGAPPYGEPQEAAPPLIPLPTAWKRPDGPAKVGLQVGHWKNNELPEELSALIGSTGASGGGKSEWEVNYAIALEIKQRLEVEEVVVELIPATVPPRYWADVFLAIHADGSEDPDKSGYKFAAPWRDYTGQADDLVATLEQYYEQGTGLAKDPNITRNMRGYYAFAWWRYHHAIDPMATAVIAETGFLTNRADRELLIYSPEVSGEAIAEALLSHLADRKLLTPSQ